MNERIQELISAYLHRGSTPEQERELFDACSRNPETAELLRQHLVLSLKLHQFRDETEVPAELHNNVLLRINALEAEGLREEERRAAAVPAPATKDASRARFGWTHLLGTGLAGAAVVALLMLATDTSQPDMASRVTPATPDTVLLVRTDTLLREVERPVYIVRDSGPTQVPERSPMDDTGQLATQPRPGDAPSARPGHVTEALDDAITKPADRFADAGNNTTTPPPALADNRSPVPVTREEKTQNYLDQYNSMLVSVESVRISSQDRLH